MRSRTRTNRQSGLCRRRGQCRNDRTIGQKMPRFKKKQLSAARCAAAARGSPASGDPAPVHPAGLSHRRCHGIVRRHARHVRQSPASLRRGCARSCDDLAGSLANCGSALGGAGTSVPFICFDLAGGANFAGSNVLVGQQRRADGFLSTAGYSKPGLPGDMLPGQDSTGLTTLLLNPGALNDFTNHGAQPDFPCRQRAAVRHPRKGCRSRSGNIDGTVIPARSDNDTGNNPHNPLYALVMTGARAARGRPDRFAQQRSGGNSMAPAMYINPNSARPRSTVPAT